MAQQVTWRCWLPAMLLALAGVIALAVASLWPHRADIANRPLAVFAWNQDAIGIVVAAGGRIVRPGGVPGSVIAIADDPEILANLYRSGAFLVLRADTAVGCTDSRPTPTRPERPSGELS
ncbi:hypothetical protein A8950_0581 [Dongia mobilis]|uniref:Uncharacterized protein n=1 Tax=Dongia mobilis TaxID=578943 RepID=A0A4R6WR34_9PROT|nr:hypothetical protein [Dongia mobilis]TDQ84035.1 hypothetical protein A8950_0581 [Dongia mobilis]